MKNVLSNVVMPPTEKASNVNIVNDVLKFTNKISSPLWEQQALHFTIDEEIKEGDWVFNPNWVLRQCKKISKTKYHSGLTLEDNHKHIWALSKCRKIVASTDESLGLPRPSNEFLKAYCEKGGIDQVLIEYEVKRVISAPYNNKGSRYYIYEGGIKPDFYTWIPSKDAKPILNYYLVNGKYFTDIIKVAPDNTITIHPVKEKTYTKDEVEILCRKAFELYKSNDEGYPGLIKSKQSKENNWIKNNL